MQKYQKITIFLFLMLTFCFMTVQTSWGQNEITFAGVTHMVDQYGTYTNLGLGIDTYPDSVISACVEDPDNITIHCFSPEEFNEELGDKYYWTQLPGPPKEGTYSFTVNFNDSTVDTATDIQGPMTALPVIQAWQVTVDGNHTGTPTLSWPDVAPGNYYRVMLFDEAWNTIYSSNRSASTSIEIPAGTIPVGINYQTRVEVHDSDSYSTLNNRTNGEYLYLDTIVIPFAGVTNVNRPDGIKTYLDLGLNVDTGEVERAYVNGPETFSYEFNTGDYLPNYGEYFKVLDGAPTLGDYIFTVELTDGTTQSVSDTQGSLETLPIILPSEYEILGANGVTPTIRWPAVPGRVLFYRLRIYDVSGNEIFRTPRLGGTANVMMPGELMSNTTYELRVEIHDSDLFENLDNRSDGYPLTFTTGDLPGPPSGPLSVIPVPWVAAAPLIPHDTYNGREITFKAIARGGNGTYEYEWDFNGDGTYDFSATTNDRYDLSARYTYPDQLFDRIFIARIRATSGGNVVTAEYPVKVHATVTRSAKVNVAIDEALWWMHQKLLRWDSGSVQFGALMNQMLGATGAAVQAWENQGHKPGGDYNSNPYVEDVRRGLNFILSKSHPYPIYIEDTRDPDTLVNGYGIHSVYQSQLYETGIVIMALASSGDASLTSEVGGFGLFGRTYADITQDMADFLAFAQNEPDIGVWRGGWRYRANYDQSDMSVTQWPVIGLEAAESNFATSVPQYVKDELEIYLAADQDPDGGFGYTSPGGNVARTGAGVACLAWIGANTGDPRVTSAINFIDNNWNWDNMGNLYAMYAVMKGMRGFEPDLKMIGSRDWYAEYADFLIANQYSDGSWTSDIWYDRDLATASGILILTPEVFASPPVAVAKASPTEASPGTVITFDHSDSFHRDPQRELVAFRWDFDEDGTWDSETGDITANPTWIYDDQIVCGEEVQHLAVLEVVDDLGNTDIDDETVVIRINLNNHPPVADGDPTDSYPNYYVTPGETVVLDASQSYDPDEGQGDSIIYWEWDLNNDGTFEVSGETHGFSIPQDWEPGSLHTVTLRVTDDGSWASECGGDLNLTDEITVTIGVGSGLECSNAEPSISKLWPPNHEIAEVNILGLTGSQGDPAIITITAITQDEPVNGLGDGDQTPDGSGVGTSTARIRSERSGIGNGRVYNIRFIALDNSGASCEGSASVYVPHDKKDVAIDDGQLYDSTMQQ
jgi:hypothetical protein